jgi:hypothetical protein
MMGFLFSLLLSLLLLLSVNFSYPQPANAAIRQQEEAPGQILYQSRHSLLDESGNSWQAILFKRVKNGQVKRIDLRLVGFPDSAPFKHPQALIITNREGKVWQAEDQFAAKSPAPNVGQYELQDILPRLPANQSVQLTLPLEKGKSVSLSVPPPVILEWQAIAAS